MFGIKREKDNVDIILKEIRNDYETLITRYNRSKNLLKQFEYRYHDAVEYRMNLGRFLEAEREAVKTMIGHAEDKMQNGSPENNVKLASEGSRGEVDSVNSEAPEKKDSFADRMIREFAERIEKYPEIIIHPDAAFEIKKLFGALSCVEKDYWAMVDRILRNTAGSKRFNDTIDIEPEINRMCIPGTEGIPSALGTYHNLLERIPRDHRAIEREEKRCLVNAAALLKRLQMEIIRALDIGGSMMEEDEKTNLSEAKVYIDSMIDDFRLKDLARLN